MDLDLSTLVSQGPWAVLSVFLLLKIFKKNESREKEDNEIIKTAHEITINHEEINKLCLSVVKQNQEIITQLTEKYNDISASVDSINLDIKQIYKIVCTKNDNCE